MTKARFEFGDQVRHQKRPEWGVGNIVRVEDIAVNGSPTQRVSVRFPNAGLKVLNTVQAELERVEPCGGGGGNGSADALAEAERLQESGWLAPVAERKIEEVMVTLPEGARDPFRSLRERVAFTLGLYRFGRDGGRLVDWAVAQSGLDDPLSRFTRQELELLYDRWAAERDSHLLRLLQDLGNDTVVVAELLRDAPPDARGVVARLQRAV